MMMMKCSKFELRNYYMRVNIENVCNLNIFREWPKHKKSLKKVMRKKCNTTKLNAKKKNNKTTKIN